MQQASEAMKVHRRAVLGAAWLICAMTAVPSAAVAGPLADAAAAMQPGEWRVVNRAGDGSGYGYDLLISCKPSGGDCGDNILNYADKGLWNPHTREVHFIGKGHIREARHIVYSEATNRWSVEPLPSWAGGDYGIAHGYEHSAIDPATGNIYLRQFNSTSIHRWNRQTKVWSPLPAGPNTAVAAAIEYFPEMGGLVYVGGGEVHFYSEAQGRWSRLASGLPMGPYHHVASYNPVHKVVIFGGGNDSRSLHRLNANGTIVPVRQAPANVGILASVFTVDPASGRHLLFTSAGGFFEYDVAADNWSSRSAAGVLMFNSDSNRIIYRVAVPIASLGVLKFLGYNGNSSTTHVYKHAPGAVQPPDTQAPPVPTGLRVQ